MAARNLCVEHETELAGTARQRHSQSRGTITDLPVDRVPELMAEGDEFCTIRGHSGVEVELETYTCSCGIKGIRTVPDDDEDNDLDNPPRCSKEH